MNTLKITYNGMYSTFYLNPLEYNGQHLNFEKSFYSGSVLAMKELLEIVNTKSFITNEALIIFKGL